MVADLEAGFILHRSEFQQGAFGRSAAEIIKTLLMASDTELMEDPTRAIGIEGDQKLKQDPFSNSIINRYFKEIRNISTTGRHSIQKLDTLLKSIGLNDEEMQSVLEDTMKKIIIDDPHHRGHTLGEPDGDHMDRYEKIDKLKFLIRHPDSWSPPTERKLRAYADPMTGLEFILSKDLRDRSFLAQAIDSFVKAIVKVHIKELAYTNSAHKLNDLLRRVIVIETPENLSLIEKILILNTLLEARSAVQGLRARPFLVDDTPLKENPTNGIMLALNVKVEAGGADTMTRYSKWEHEIADSYLKNLINREFPADTVVQGGTQTFLELALKEAQKGRSHVGENLWHNFIKDLFRGGAKADIQYDVDGVQITPLMHAMEKFTNVKIINLLIENSEPGTINKLNSKTGHTALTLAIERCNKKYRREIREYNIRLILNLILNGADPNGLDSGGFTPLTIVIDHENLYVSDKLKIVKILLENIDNLDRLEDHILRKYLTFGFENNCLEILNSILTSGQININQLLKVSVQTKNAEIFTYLLDSIDDVNTVQIDEETLLTFTVKSGDHDLLKIILEKTEANPNLTNKAGESPLSLSRGKKKLSQLLINHGAHIDIFDAIGINSLKSVQDLIKKGLNVNKVHNSDGETPLTFAVKNNKLKIVKLLLENIDNLDRLEDNILSNYLKFAFKNNCLELLNSILKSGQIHITQLLKAALETKNGKIFTYLLDSIDDVNTVQINGETLLTLAVKRNDHQLLKFILKKTNVDANLTNSHGESPLSLSRGNENLLKLLIKHGAHIDIFDAINLDSDTSKEYTEKALEGNINVNEVHNSDGETPIIFAIKNGKSEIVKLLLANGAHIDIFDAISLDSLESVESWARRAAQSSSFNEVNSDGETPIKFALKNGKSEIVEILLKYGANTDKLSEIEKFKLLCIVENISAMRVDELIKEMQNNGSCPITLEEFKDLEEPVLCTDGYVYEKAGIQAHWRTKGSHVSPMSRDQIRIVSPELNTLLKLLIDKFAPEAAAEAASSARLKKKRSKKKKEKRTKGKKLRKDKKTESKDKKTGHKDTKRKDKKPERKDKKRKDKKTKGKHKRKV